jgi:uncharacterized protein (TIGR02145 family)
MSFSSFFAVSVFADGADFADVPFVVNVNAKVTASKDGASPVFIDVNAGVEKTLKIPLGKTNSVMLGAQNRLNAPVLTSNNRGKVSLSLPSQLYKSAEISLYSINGKRIARSKASASESAKNLSRPNLTAGVYILSVKGADGHSFSNRVTHRGGSLNIGVAFANSGFSTSPFASANTSEDWTITVSAIEYGDSVYTLNVVKGGNPVQNITLKSVFNPNITYGSFTDTRAGANNRVYRTVEIGDQTWFAENLHYAGEDGDIGVCYGNEPDNCAKYGRLYTWAQFMDGSSSSSLNPSGVRGICPEGWHVPSAAEWSQLKNFLNSVTFGESGTMLRSQTGWYTGGGYIPGTDDYGFSALPGGNSGISFHGAGRYGEWWSTTQRLDGSWVMCAEMRHNSKLMDEQTGSRSGLWRSLRCVKDERP